MDPLQVAADIARLTSEVAWLKLAVLPLYPAIGGLYLLIGKNKKG